MAGEIVSDEKLIQWFPNESAAELGMQRDAAEAYIWNRCIIPEPLPGSEVPGDLVGAVRLLVARYLARRNSPDGTLGMSEFGAGRIATVDRDIEAMLAPYRPVVFG